MLKYLADNYMVGFKTSPLHGLRFSIGIISVYAFVAALVGFWSGLFTIQLIDSKIAFILPFTLFIFPSFLEESFFRGIIIPVNTREKGINHIAGFTLISSLLFVIWHPLNAVTINPGARTIFLNPYFLIVAFCLGIACSLTYIYSKSLWVPVIVHWLTVFVWIFFLGGRNLILR